MGVRSTFFSRLSFFGWTGRRFKNCAKQNHLLWLVFCFEEHGLVTRLYIYIYMIYVYM